MLDDNLVWGYLKVGRRGELSSGFPGADQPVNHILKDEENTWPPVHCSPLLVPPTVLGCPLLVLMNLHIVNLGREPCRGGCLPSLLLSEWLFSLNISGHFSVISAIVGALHLGLPSLSVRPWAALAGLAISFWASTSKGRALLDSSDFTLDCLVVLASAGLLASQGAAQMVPRLLYCPAQLAVSPVTETAHSQLPPKHLPSTPRTSGKTSLCSAYSMDRWSCQHCDFQTNVSNHSSSCQH